MRGDENMKKILSIVCSILLMVSLFTPLSMYANEDDSKIYYGYRPVETDKKEPYYVDQYGRVSDEKPDSEIYVYVLYDSRWDNPGKSVIVSQYININGIVLRGAAGGTYGNSQYNCTMGVGLTIYFDSSTLNITSVGTPSIISFYCPCSPSGRSAPWATSYASQGRAYVNGYVTYYYHTTETLTGTGVWYF